MAKNKKTLDLIALASVPFIMVLGNSMLIPILPQMKNELQISQLEVSLVITLFSISAAIMIPFSGFLSDRFGRKKVIIPSLMLFALGGVVAGLASWFLVEKTAYWTMLAGRTIQGIGAAGTAPITMALAGDMFKGGAQSKALGVIEATNGLGKVASPILGTLIAFIVWFAPFFAFSILCVFSILAMIFMAKEPPLKSEPPKLKAYISSVVDIFKTDGRWLIATFFIGTIGLFVLFGVLFYLSDILETRYQIDGLYKGYILAVPLLAMATTSYITGRLIKKKFPLMKKLIVIGLLLMASALIPLMFLEQLVVLILLLAVNGIGTGLALPCINSFITGSVNKAKRGMITSLYGSVRFGGVALGPPVFGWLMTMESWILFGSNVVLILLAAFWAIFAIRVENKGKGDSSDSSDSEDEHNAAWERLALSNSTP
ncbi:MFS transporter [Caldalkalibacillus salinus]|uniref:MFS transporter n=1 Tax=Caldalkalibacillus salinus TaxID=2803787 RepID=UPI0019228F84|nr:MFS transporter [Caldalkalibacillus salinus]